MKLFLTVILTGTALPSPQLDTTGDGTFALDVQPGHYTVMVTAEGFDPERREVDVEHNGVTVLLIDLRGTR